MGIKDLISEQARDTDKTDVAHATTAIGHAIRVTSAFLCVALLFALIADDILPADLEEAESGFITNTPRFLMFAALAAVVLFLTSWSVSRQLVEARRKLKKSENELVRRLGQAAEWRDDETGDHTLRVGEYCAAIAEGLGWNQCKCDAIKVAGMLHDIGKIGIPDFVMVKVGELSPEERQLIQAHTLMGSDILDDSDVPLIQMAQKIAASHHEKWDGTGYPYALAGEEIPLEGRIAALADVFDALTSRRRYKDAWTFDQAVKEVNILKGSQFDPKVVEAFERSLPKIREIYEKYQSSSRIFRISRAA